MRSSLQMSKQKACKVCVHALVSADKLVGESQPRHQAPLFQPKNRREGAGEENALHGRKSYKPLRETRPPVFYPPQSPVRFALDARDGLDSVEEELPFLGVGNVRVDELGVGLGMDVLHHDLESIKATSLCSLDFV